MWFLQNTFWKLTDLWLITRQELSDRFKTVILLIGFISQAGRITFQDLFKILQECWTYSSVKSQNIWLFIYFLTHLLSHIILSNSSPNARTVLVDIDYYLHYFFGAGFLGLGLLGFFSFVRVGAHTEIWLFYGNSVLGKLTIFFNCSHLIYLIYPLSTS